MQEPARIIAHELVRTGHWIAVHVHVEHAHEDRDTRGPRSHVHGLIGLPDVHDLPVRGREDVLIAAWACSDGIAEEHEQPYRDQRPRHECGPHPRTPYAYPPSPDADQGPPRNNEGPALGRDAHQAVARGLPVMRRHASR